MTLVRAGRAGPYFDVGAILGAVHGFALGRGHFALTITITITVVVDLDVWVGGGVWAGCARWGHCGLAGGLWVLLACGGGFWCVDNDG